MPRFRAKPFELDASRWFKEGDHPAVVMQAWGDVPEAPYVNTRQGWVRVHPGDWIVTLPDGETYPCKPDVFAAKYAPADGESASAKARGLLERLWSAATTNLPSGEGPRDVAIDWWRDADHRFLADRVAPEEIREALEQTGGVPR